MNLAKAYETVVISQSTAGTAALKAGAAGKVNRLHELHVTATSTGASTLTLKSGSNAISGAMPLLNATPLSRPFTPQIEPCLASTAGAALNLTVADGGALGWAVVSQSTA